MLVERLRETGLADRCWTVPARQVGHFLGQAKRAEPLVQRM